MTTKSPLVRSTFACPNTLDHRWGVILAGGDGKRLLPLTRRIAGDNRPKQFCAIMHGETLLAQTQCRVGRMIEPGQTLLVVTKTQECFYADQLAGTPSRSLVVQPFNRGTTPAILYSLLRLREWDPNAVVGFFPSDHHFADDEALLGYVDSAFEAAESPSGPVVLLGIVPSSAEAEYGWIEPGPSLTNHAFGATFQVRRFWEKPTYSLASVLMERGCLWNSFVMVGRVDAFLGLIRRALPSLFACFESIRRSLFSAKEWAAMLEVYSGIRTSNFSDDVLAVNPNDLAVLPCRNLGWSDLGETGRVLSVLEQNGISAEWAPACIEECSARG